MIYHTNIQTHNTVNVDNKGHILAQVYAW